jgi:hypothetical protein
MCPEILLPVGILLLFGTFLSLYAKLNEQVEGNDFDAK